MVVVVVVGISAERFLVWTGAGSKAGLEAAVSVKALGRLGTGSRRGSEGLMACAMAGRGLGEGVF